MQETARLAGFFAAHGIWCVADGAVLTPLLGYEQADGDRAMTRFAAADLESSVLAGREALDANATSATRAALVVDGFIHLAAQRTDALIVRAVSYFPERRSMAVAMPYRPQSDPDGFAVRRPKFLGFDNVDRDDYAELVDAFHEGLGSHARAAEVWDAHLVETI